MGMLQPSAGRIYAGSAGINAASAHGFGDLNRFPDDCVRLLSIGVGPIDSHAQERVAPGVFISRIQIQVIASVCEMIPRTNEGGCPVLPFQCRLLPLRAPGSWDFAFGNLSKGRN